MQPVIAFVVSSVATFSTIFLFDDINSTRTLRKDVIEKVFPNENITIENKGNPMLSQYITSNGFKITFEKPFRMIIECACNGDDKKEEYINLIAQISYRSVIDIENKNITIYQNVVGKIKNWFIDTVSLDKTEKITTIVSNLVNIFK